jgi:hypothetical protein
MTVREKLKEAVEALGGRHRPVRTREIVAYFREHFPEVAESGILPADHCINLVGGRRWDREMGLPRNFYFLHRTEPGKYEIYDPSKHGPPEKWLGDVPGNQARASRVATRVSTGSTGCIPGIAELWGCLDEGKWKAALDHYWDLVKPQNRALEEEMNTLSERVKSFSDIQDWYSFLLGKYFTWKYTAPNRLATTTKHFVRAYGADRGELNSIIRSLFAFDREDISEGLCRASGIKGLGTAGASGLLALLFPEHFATVDQFVVKALQGVSTIPGGDPVRRMKPEDLTGKDGVILIRIMRRKAEELNATFKSTFWTPRKIDMVLWAARV